MPEEDWLPESGNPLKHGVFTLAAVPLGLAKCNSGGKAKLGSISAARPIGSRASQELRKGGRQLRLFELQAGAAYAFA